MLLKIAYCPICNKRVPYLVESYYANANGDWGFFTYKENNAFCKKCGEKLSIRNLDKRNKNSMKKAYVKDKIQCQIRCNANYTHYMDGRFERIQTI